MNSHQTILGFLYESSRSKKLFHYEWDYFAQMPLIKVDAFEDDLMAVYELVPRVDW